MMKSILVNLLLLVAISTSAAEIKFLDNPVWASVLEQAKKENKIIFFDAYATWCAPCKQMDDETYTNDSVAEFYNSNFINVKYDMEKGEGPMLADRYYVTAYPNLIFISPDGIMLHKAVGFKASNEFLNLAKSAKDPDLQYYTLKSKAAKLSDADFLKFAKKASDLQDEEFGPISRDFLASKQDILGSSDLVELMMNYIYLLPKEEDLAYFAANKSKVLREGKYTEDDFQERLVSLVVQFALSEDVQVADEIDFDAIKKILDKYVPEQALFVFNYFKTQYYLENKEIDLALAAFDEILSNPSKIAYSQIANSMANIGPVLFNEGKLDTYLTKFDSIKVPEKDAKWAYLKNFVKSVVYIRTKQTDKFKTIVETILADDITPEEVKKDLKLALQNVNAN
jgi:thiol-disulfide isomerase/thioredoxin